jgi:hypothetical protein
MAGTALEARGEGAITMLIKTLALVASGIVLATSAFAQSAREVRGAPPYVTIENEPAPKLIVDPPASRSAGQGHRPDPIPGRERAHRTGVWRGRPPCLSTGRASA